MKRGACREREAYAKGGTAYLRRLNCRRMRVTPQRLRWWWEAARQLIANVGDVDARLLAVATLGERSLNLGLPLAPVRPRGRSGNLFTVSVPSTNGCIDREIELPKDADVVVAALATVRSALIEASCFGPKSDARVTGQKRRRNP